jgi:hypothetical protein
MARKVRVTVSRSKKRRLLTEYKEAVAERRRLVTYLKAAKGILSKGELELLSDFAQIAKRKCDRLRRAMQRHTSKHAA